MPRGNTQITQVIYKGKEDHFIIFLDSEKDFEAWKSDSTVPLSSVVAGFKIFVSHKHGSQGILDEATRGQLESEFGTHDVDTVITRILREGELQHSKSQERHGEKNENRGSHGAQNF
eukprot:TRINITY_DN12851_c0_g1_i1.p2 TRINITY_DN12851_c0_g1~~TRINITY_DN12851_c0_g1_i1.p2  ORF type:complete len:117 (+),score=22.44 TRINITY_DN12851_c0_g1_i1:42-392(+)